MYLTANAYGIGCYFSTGGITYIEEAKEFFNLSSDDKLIGFFYIGKKKEMPEVNLTRGDIREKVLWVD
jgi:nitroreductase